MHDFMGRRIPKHGLLILFETRCEPNRPKLGCWCRLMRDVDWATTFVATNEAQLILISEYGWKGVGMQVKVVHLPLLRHIVLLSEGYTPTVAIMLVLHTAMYTTTSTASMEIIVGGLQVFSSENLGMM